MINNKCLSLGMESVWCVLSGIFRCAETHTKLCLGW